MSLLFRGCPQKQAGEAQKNRCTNKCGRCRMKKLVANHDCVDVFQVLMKGMKQTTDNIIEFRPRSQRPSDTWHPSMSYNGGLRLAGAKVQAMAA